MLTVAVAFVTGLFTAVVAIYGQWASSYTALKVKNLEVLFARKADAYKEVIEKAWEFGNDPTHQENFLSLRNSIYAALIIASKDIADALDDNPRTNLHATAVLLRTTANDTPQDVPRVQMHQWREAAERLKAVIRADMAGLSESPRIRDFFLL
jgi:hypothetical protein